MLQWANKRRRFNKRRNLWKIQFRFYSEPGARAHLGVRTATVSLTMTHFSSCLCNSRLRNKEWSDLLSTEKIGNKASYYTRVHLHLSHRGRRWVKLLFFYEDHNNGQSDHLQFQYNWFCFHFMLFSVGTSKKRIIGMGFIRKWSSARLTMLEIKSKWVFCERLHDGTKLYSIEWFVWFSHRLLSLIVAEC